MQVMLRRVPPQARVVVVFVSYITVGSWVVLNARNRPRSLRAAFLLIGAGWAMNTAVMVPNGGMPVSGDALVGLGAGATYDVASGHLYKHVLADGSTEMAWLGDILPVAPLRAVISVGDVLMAVGVVLLMSSAMTDAAPRPAVALTPPP